MQVSRNHQHLNDHRNRDHPFERLLVDTAVGPDGRGELDQSAPATGRGSPRDVPHPGKTGVVSTLDRATGESLWRPWLATPTVAQDVISSIDRVPGGVLREPGVGLRRLPAASPDLPTAMAAGPGNPSTDHRKAQWILYSLAILRSERIRKGQKEPKKAAGRDGNGWQCCLGLLAHYVERSDAP